MGLFVKLYGKLSEHEGEMAIVTRQPDVRHPTEPSKVRLRTRGRSSRPEYPKGCDERALKPCRGIEPFLYPLTAAGLTPAAWKVLQE
jgi:hypothetical protein